MFLRIQLLSFKHVLHSLGSFLIIGSGKNGPLDGCYLCHVLYSIFFFNTGKSDPLDLMPFRSCSLFCGGSKNHCFMT